MSRELGRLQPEKNCLGPGAFVKGTEQSHFLEEKTLRHREWGRRWLSARRGCRGADRVPTGATYPGTHCQPHGWHSGFLFMSEETADSLASLFERKTFYREKALFLGELKELKTCHSIVVTLKFWGFAYALEGLLLGLQSQEQIQERRDEARCPQARPRQEASWAVPPLPTLVALYSVFLLRFLFSIGSQNSGPFPPLPTDLVFPAFIRRVLTEQGLCACLSNYRRPSLLLTPVSWQSLVDPIPFNTVVPVSFLSPAVFHLRLNWQNVPLNTHPSNYLSFLPL